MKFARILALLILAMLIVFTVVPADERPETGVAHDFEHFGAFLLPGLLLAFGFAWKTRSLLLAAVVFTLALECAQIPLPTRHARLEDFIVDSIAICVGIVIARLGAKILRPQSQF